MDFRVSYAELSTDIFVAGVNIDSLELLLLRMLKALPPPVDKTAEAVSKCEMSALICSLYYLSDSAVTD